MTMNLCRIAALAALLLMTGCAARAPLSPPRPAPPVSAPLPTTPSPAEPGFLPPLEPSLIPPAAPPVTVPSENAAVMALLRKSQNQSSAGQWEAAGASLERALRIEPRNPVLWQKLARVRLAQQDYPQAENLAAKSSALAGNDRRLRAENWRIIGEARSKRGDRAGAKAAFERAEGE